MKKMIADKRGRENGSHPLSHLRAKDWETNMKIMPFSKDITDD